MCGGLAQSRRHIPHRLFLVVVVVVGAGSAGGLVAVNCVDGTSEYFASSCRTPAATESASHCMDTMLTEPQVIAYLQWAHMQRH